MKLQLLGVLLLSVACLASEGQGIDEEKVEPDWETSEEYDDNSSSSEYIDEQGEPIIPPEWIPRSMLAQQDDIVIKLNKGVDKVLEILKATFQSLGLVSIPLPDISKPFGHSPYGGTFKACQGYFSDPTSLQRTGDVQIVVHNGTTITLQVQLGFKNTEAGFKHYHLDVLNIHLDGDVVASVSENSLLFKFTMTYAPSCNFNLEEFRFDKLGGIKVKISGLGVFQTMYNELSYWLINNFESTFRQIINHKLYESANKALLKKDICKYFPH